MQMGACIFGGVTGHSIPSCLQTHPSKRVGALMAQGIGEESEDQDVELSLKWWDTKEQVCDGCGCGFGHDLYMYTCIARRLLLKKSSSLMTSLGDSSSASRP